MVETAGPQVVSLGSINIDRVYRLDDATLETLADRPWLPERGETVAVDTPPDIPLEPDAIHHGGKGANQATAAAAAGTSATMLGHVGPDHTEYAVRSRLATDGVAADDVETVAASTGTAHVFVDADGNNRILVYAGANNAVDEKYINAHYETILNADCLLLQNEIPVAPVAGLLDHLDAASDPPLVVLDPGPPQNVDQLLAAGSVTHLTPNEQETTALGALDLFDGTMVATRGSGPVIITAPDGHQTVVRPPSVAAVDTTGAGDVLNGYLAASLADGVSLREAVARGVAAATLSTRSTGARSSVPDQQAVAAFRAEHGSGL